MDKDVYHAADIYTLSKRHVEGDEKRVLENRMMWILTGEEHYWQDFKAIGREAGVQKKIEDAQKRKLGTTRTKKRKGKRSNFYQRPNRKR
jgi:hypothetical protein